MGGGLMLPTCGEHRHRLEAPGDQDDQADNNHCQPEQFANQANARLYYVFPCLFHADASFSQFCIANLMIL